MSALALQDLASQINAEHAAAEKHADQAVQHARRAGELLLQAKKTCAHGEWLAWIEKNLTVTPRMAQNYMRIAQGLPGLSAADAKRVSQMPVRKALQTIAINSVALSKMEPQERSEVIDKIDGGQPAHLVLDELRRKKILARTDSTPPSLTTIDGREVTAARHGPGKWTLDFAPNAAGTRITELLQAGCEKPAVKGLLALADRLRREAQELETKAKKLRAESEETESAARRCLIRALEREHGPISPYREIYYVNVPEDVEDQIQHAGGGAQAETLLLAALARLTVTACINQGDMHWMDIGKPAIQWTRIGWTRVGLQAAAESA